MQPSNIGNSGFLLGALLAGFLLWLLVNNRLGTYWNLMIGGGSSSGAAPSSVTSSTGVLNPFNVLIPGQGIANWLGSLFGGKAN